jgi:hypothetical protein
MANDTPVKQDDIPVKPNGMFREAIIPKGNDESTINLRLDGDHVKFSDTDLTTRSILDVWHNRITFHDFKTGDDVKLENALVAKASKEIIDKAFADNRLTASELSQIDQFKSILITDIRDGKFDDVTSIVKASGNFIPSMAIEK